MHLFCGIWAGGYSIKASSIRDAVCSSVFTASPRLWSAAATAVRMISKMIYFSTILIIEWRNAFQQSCKVCADFSQRQVVYKGVVEQESTRSELCAKMNSCYYSTLKWQLSWWKKMATSLTDIDRALELPPFRPFFAPSFCVWCTTQLLVGLPAAGRCISRQISFAKAWPERSCWNVPKPNLDARLCSKASIWCPFFL